MSLINQPQRIVFSGNNSRPLASTPNKAQFQSKGSRIDSEAMDLMRSMNQASSVYAQHQASNQVTDEKAERKRKNQSKTAFNANSAEHVDRIFLDVESEYAGQSPDDAWKAMEKHASYEKLYAGVAPEDRLEFETKIKAKSYSRFTDYLRLERDRKLDSDTHFALTNIANSADMSEEERQDGLQAARSNYLDNGVGTEGQLSDQFSALAATVVKQAKDAGKLNESVWLYDNLELTGSDAIGLASATRQDIQVIQDKETKKKAKAEWQAQGEELISGETLDEAALDAWVKKSTKHDPDFNDVRKQEKLRKDTEELFHTRKLTGLLNTFAQQNDVTSGAELRTQAEFYAQRYEDTTGVKVTASEFITTFMQQREADLRALMEDLEVQPDNPIIQDQFQKANKAYIQLAPSIHRSRIEGLFSTPLDPEATELTANHMQRLEIYEQVIEAFDGDVAKAARAYFPKNDARRETLMLFDVAQRLLGDNTQALKLATSEEVRTVPKTYKDGIEDAVKELAEGYPPMVQESVRTWLSALGSRSFVSMEIAKEMGALMLQDQTIEVGDRKLIGAHAQKTYSALAKEADRLNQVYHAIDPSPFRSDEEQANRTVDSMMETWVHANWETLQTVLVGLEEPEDVTFEVHPLYPHEFYVSLQGQRTTNHMRLSSQDLIDNFKKARGIEE